MRERDICLCMVFHIVICHSSSFVIILIEAVSQIRILYNIILCCISQHANMSPCGDCGVKDVYGNQQ